MRHRSLLRGLRLRFLLALLLTSLATLVVAATVLLSPLQERLRAQSANNLRGTVQDSVDRFQKAYAATHHNDPFAIQRAAVELRQRTDGRILVGTTACCEFLYDTDGGGRSDMLASRSATLVGFRALREQRTVTVVDGDVVRVAARLFGGDGPEGVLIAERRLTEVTAAVAQIRNALLAAAAVGLLVAIALGIALSSTLLRRLGRLRTAALRITEEGVDAPLEHDAGLDEVGDLARAFTRMQEELRRQEAARRSFVATASHELRTPLTMLQGTMELLEEDLAAGGHVDTADLQAQVARARRELMRLSNLSAELLDLSRLDASVPLRSEPVELGELARAVAAEFGLRASERDVEVVVVPPERDCWSRGDPDAIARVVRILIDNALRYGPDREPIELSVGCEGQRTVLRVADHGPGVPPAERERIFQRFQRGRSAASTAGFGLGLAIGRELAQRMHGTLVLTDHPAPGTEFVLELPAAEPAAGAPPRPRPDERPAALNP
jgi:signal transduction histidine kinase